MSVRIIYLIGLGLLIAGAIFTYLHTAGKYGISVPVIVFLLFALGIACAALSIQSSFQKANGSGFLFAGIVSFFFLLAAYFATRIAGNASVLSAAVFTSCFFFPSVIVKNWQLYRLAFQPVAVSPWILPVPYIRSNAISLHLNSIPFTIRLAATPGGEEQSFSVTAPGIKTLGLVFSELVYEEKSSGQSADFSDIANNTYAWVFYARAFGGLSVRQLDANLSLLDNRVKMNDVVIAQRQ